MEINKRMNQTASKFKDNQTSYIVENCHVCNNADLRSILFLGYLPPVNKMNPIRTRPAEQPAYPAEWLQCSKCKLVQIGLVVDPKILFPPEYPYTSSTTKILKENIPIFSLDMIPTLLLDPKLSDH